MVKGVRSYMNIRIIYQSITGNTKKVAEAIAQAVGCNAESIESNIVLGSIDLLFAINHPFG